MKKLFTLLFLFCILLTACGSKDDIDSYEIPEYQKNNDQSDVKLNGSLSDINSDALKDEEDLSNQEVEQKENKNEDIEIPIDIDMSKLSGTMVYAEASNMAMTPEKYLGKIVKMKGFFSIDYESDASGNILEDKKHFICFVTDPPGCCTQAIEFILKDGYVYPDDFPQIQDEILIVGEFQTCKDAFGFEGPCLINANIVE